MDKNLSKIVPEDVFPEGIPLYITAAPLSQNPFHYLGKFFGCLTMLGGLVALKSLFPNEMADMGGLVTLILVASTGMALGTGAMLGWSLVPQKIINSKFQSHLEERLNAYGLDEVMTWMLEDTPEHWRIQQWKEKQTAETDVKVTVSPTLEIEKDLLWEDNTPFQPLMVNTKDPTHSRDA